MRCVATRIPPEWQEKLNQFCEITGKTPADVLRDALGQYISVEIPRQQSELEQLRSEQIATQQRVAQLEHRLKLLAAVS